MTPYEMLLIAAAAEAAGTRLEVAEIVSLRGEVTGWQANGRRGTSRADALTVLLTDLGADVPEWPTFDHMEERVITRLLADTDEDDLLTVLQNLRALALPEQLALLAGVRRERPPQ